MNSSKNRRTFLFKPRVEIIFILSKSNSKALDQFHSSGVHYFLKLLKTFNDPSRLIIVFKPWLILIQWTALSFPIGNIGQWPRHVVDFLVGGITLDEWEVTVVYVFVDRIEML